MKSSVPICEDAPTDSLSVRVTDESLMGVVKVLQGRELLSDLPQLQSLGPTEGDLHPNLDLRWLRVLHDGLRHTPFCITVENGPHAGRLPLVLVHSAMFGRFLVGLSFVSTGGVQTSAPSIARHLIDRAVALADELDVKSLELRHETPIEHPALTETSTSKVHCRLRLPQEEEGVLQQLKSKVRSQVRKASKEHNFEVCWGKRELLPEFYQVFARNMRDLGTPVFGKSLFQSILEQFPDEAEFCCVRLHGRTIAAALLIHGDGITEVPCASALRDFRSTNVNMHMYWQLLCRAVQRGQRVFDFGRSTVDSGTHRFKRQWGAEESACCWQYYRRRGDGGQLNKENDKFQSAIEIWKRLPVWVSRWIGPSIARSIP